MKTIVLFINGLPMSGKFNETVQQVSNTLFNFSSLKVIPSFNSFNLIRTKVSAGKNDKTMNEELLNVCPPDHFINKTYNIFDIKKYTKEYITQISKTNPKIPINLLMKYYSPQWLLNNLAISKFLEENISLNFSEIIFIRIRPDKLSFLSQALNRASSNFENILNSNYFYWMDLYSCGVNDHLKDLDFDYRICDQLSISNYQILKVFRDFCNQINNVHNDPYYQHLASRCAIEKKYNLLVNNETKLCYYLKLNNVKVCKI